MLIGPTVTYQYKKVKRQRFIISVVEISKILSRPKILNKAFDYFVRRILD